MKRFTGTFSFFFFGFLILLTFSSCQSFRLDQRYRDIKKVAVHVRAEADTLRTHISKAMFKSPVVSSSTQKSITDTVLIADTAPDEVGQKTFSFSVIKNVAQAESMRLVTKYESSYNRSEGKMAAGDTNIWWLWGVLIFLAAFMIAVALIRWISESGSGCLVIGSWILFTGLLVWLLFWMIL